MLQLRARTEADSRLNTVHTARGKEKMRDAALLRIKTTVTVTLTLIGPGGRTIPAARDISVCRGTTTSCRKRPG